MYTSNYQPPKYIITPQSVLTSQPYEDSDNKEWLENALELNGALISAAPEVRKLADYILPDLQEAIITSGFLKIIHTSNSRKKIKQTLKVILLNCYTAYLLGLPVRYSRDSHYYSKPKRYGIRYFKYNSTIAIVHALEEMKYINQKLGIYNKEISYGRQSRMWASEKLIRLFQEYLFSTFQISQLIEREEIIELRDEETIGSKKIKFPIKYQDNQRTKSKRKNLRLYNDLMDLTEITIRLDQNTPASLNHLCKKILRSALTGGIHITSLTVNTSRVSDLTNQTLKSQYNSYTTTTNNSLSSSMTHKNFNLPQVIRGLQSQTCYEFEPVKISSTANFSSPDEKVFIAILSLITKKHLFINRTLRKRKVSRKEEISRRNAEKHSLSYYGIEEIEFTVNAKKLHRVFNQEKFNRGGRFYGAYHETIPKKFRRHIKINGQSTVELDYSAHHLRMAYHLTGINYQDDPYMALTTDKDERGIYKKLCFIAVNAETEIKAIRGFRKVARVKGLNISKTDETIRSLLDRVKEVHQPITEYIHSEEGLYLQYRDSQITEKILMNMMKQGIPCLPVHDSYVVPVQHEEQLREAMMAEYKKLMGFEPVIEKN